jgi:protein TonB
VFGAPASSIPPVPPPPPAPGWPANAVRVGGNMKMPVKTKHVAPNYPAVAQTASVQGVVILELIIGGDGKVQDARILRSIPLLDQSAVDAVKQWEFTPTLLNGAPVPVIMTATVQFTLQP